MDIYYNIIIEYKVKYYNKIYRFFFINMIYLYIITLIN